MSGGRTRGAAGAPLASGLLIAAAFPPFSVLPAAFLGLVPLLLHLATLPGGRDGRWRALRAGLVTGGVAYGATLYWIVPALGRASALLAPPAFLLVTLALATGVGLFAAATHALLERRAAPLALAAPVLWTAMEWAQAHLGDLAFAWVGLASTLAPHPVLAGAADLAGARGLAFWIVLVNGLAAAAVLAVRRGARPLRPLLGAACALLLPALYGYARAATLETRPAARVAVVQPDIPQEVKTDPARGLDSSRVALFGLTRRLRPGQADLVVWPEVALPIVLDAPEAATLRGEIARLAREVGAPILVGAYGGGAGGGLRNAAFLATPDGRLEPAYAKRRLVPFVERVPFVEPRLLGRLLADPDRYGGLERGGEAGAVDAGAARVGVLICSESAFAPLARRARAGGAEILVNATNDAWFGVAGQERTTARWQHPAQLVLRSVETRAGAARAASTGFSLFVDPLGRVYGRTRLSEPALRIAAVHTTDGLTLYARWGDWAGLLCALLSLALGLRARRERRAAGRLPVAAS